MVAVAVVVAGFLCVQGAVAAQTVKQGSKVLLWYSLDAGGEVHISSVEVKVPK